MGNWDTSTNERFIYVAFSMILLRPATIDDHSQIAALDRDIFGGYGADESPQVIQARLETFPAGCFVLEEQSMDAGELRIVGYLTAEKWASIREPALNENPKATHDPAGHVLCITTLAIADTHQNQGLGKRLIDKAMVTARNENCREIILETAHAPRFYKKHGFRCVRHRIQRGIQLYIMHSELESAE